jgi:hypothetical protein
MVGMGTVLAFAGMFLDRIQIVQALHAAAFLAVVALLVIPEARPMPLFLFEGLDKFGSRPLWIRILRRA